MSVLEPLLRRVSESFLAYLHLWTWVDQRVTHYLSGRPKRDFVSVKDFWDCVFQEILSPGDRVRFSEAFVTEWVPRLPGQLWRETGRSNEALLAGLREQSPNTRYSMTGPSDSDWFPGPVGVVRLPFGTDKLQYAALSMTTVDSWCCDLGIPIVASSSVYDALLRARIGNNAVEATLEGVVMFGVIPLFDPSLVTTLGSHVGSNLVRQLHLPSGLPTVYIHVASPLDVSFRSHNSHPLGFLWALERHLYSVEPRHHRISTTNVRTSKLRHLLGYPLLVAQTDLTEPDEIRSIVDSFKKGITHRKDPVLEEQLFYAADTPRRRLQSVDVLTEFDARQRYFSAKIRLEKEPWTRDEARFEIAQVLADIRALLDGSKRESRSDDEIV